jgi:hypothetical protein
MYRRSSHGLNQSSKSAQSVVVQWENGDRNSGSFTCGVGDGTIGIGTSFRLLIYVFFFLFFFIFRFAEKQNIKLMGFLENPIISSRNSYSSQKGEEYACLFVGE